jgi:hypothetical protein
VSPTIAPFPLEVARPALSAKQKEELNNTLKVLLLRNGISSVDALTLKVSLADLRREDCDREDQCLAQLATRAGTLYAMFASVKLTVAGEVVANGRVVRDDGKLVASLAAEDVVRLPKGKAPFAEVAELALRTLIERLKIRALPLSKPSESPSPLPPVVEVKPDPSETPPPLPPVMLEDKGASHRVIGRSLVIAGGGVLVVGAVLGSVGLGIAGGLAPTTNGSVPRDSVGTANTAATLRTTGVIAMGAGAALAIVGGVLWGIAPKAPGVQVFVSPQTSGATVGLSGGF